MGERIEKHCSLLPTPIYVLEPDKAGQYLNAWSFSDASGSRNYLAKHLASNPETVFSLMRCFLGTAWAMTTGMPLEADFERHSYDAMTRLIDSDLVAQALLSIYGDQLKTPQFHLSNREPRELRLANQFMFIRKRISEEEKAQAGSNTGTVATEQEEEPTDPQGARG